MAENVPMKSSPEKLAYARNYYQRNRERYALQARERRLRDPEKERSYRKAYYWRDPERARAQTRKWQEANPERHRISTLNSHFRRTYGITWEEYRRDVIGQAGRCLVCGRVPDHRLVVDHDHKTGAYRGLLCQNCNRLLGDAHDDPRVLQAAARYVSP